MIFTPLVARNYMTGRGLCFWCNEEADLVNHPRHGWLCEDCESLLDCPMCGEVASWGHCCLENSN